MEGFEVFSISLEILDSVPVVFAGGMGISIVVVSAVSLFVSGFKALLRVAGR